MTMLLEGIETLLVLSKAKTMSRTGSLLYISQSAVSKRIANLEKKLSKKLIEPEGRHVKLTQDGISLIESIGPTFNELRGLIYEQQSIIEHSIIRLDCSETLIAGYLSTALGECVQRDNYITLTTNHTPRIIEHVQSGIAQIGVCAGYLPTHHSLTTFHLFDEPFYIVYADSLTQLPATIITNDLKNPANTYQLAILNQLDMKPIMEMDSYAAAAQLALAGVAPALVPLSVVKTLKIGPEYCHHFNEIEPLHRPVHICLRPSSYRNTRIKAVIETIVDAAAKVVLSPLTST